MSPTGPRPATPPSRPRHYLRLRRQLPSGLEPDAALAGAFPRGFALDSVGTR
jgi:hypothetical protein